MRGIRFQRYVPTTRLKSDFDQFMRIFQDILLHTSGDVMSALAWMTQLVNQYEIASSTYNMSDFIDDLTRLGFIDTSKEDNQVTMNPTRKMEIALRRQALDDVFTQLNKAKSGKHSSHFTGKGEEMDFENRKFEFGDPLEQISISESIKNAHINHGIENFKLTSDDLEVRETLYQTQASTVLMIDISHSMILYGEDRITPAKKVAMALAELITTRYPKDTLDIIVFGNDAWRIDLQDLPYLQVGPFHTNTVAGLELAIDILRKHRSSNKQIMMITDGKPTCIKKGKKYYKNPYGLDATILNRTIGLASKCRKLGINITTFMIAQDSYLVQFVEEFTRANNGKAFYSSLEGLGEFVFQDYRSSRTRRL